MADLGALWPSVSSVSVVPVGLTKYRQGLCQLTPFTPAGAGAVLDQIHRFTDAFLKEHGTRLIYPGDEFFILAGRPLPDSGYYGDFEQLQNGVGMTALLLEEFESELARLEAPVQTSPCDLITGVCAADYIRGMVDALARRVPGLQARVHVIENEYFGGNVTVAGLVTATDIERQAGGKLLSDRVLVPTCMLRHEQDKFLDDVPREALEARLGAKLTLVENDGYGFIQAVLGGNAQ